MTNDYLAGGQEVPLGVECAWQPQLPAVTGGARRRRRLRAAAVLAMAFGLWHTVQAACSPARPEEASARQAAANPYGMTATTGQRG